MKRAGKKFLCSSSPAAVVYAALGMRREERAGIGGGTCKISISCASVLDHMEDVKETKREFVPADGWILPETEVVIYEDESVYDVLVRVCQENKIHMEASFVAAYNASYIEGIGQLYEFDGGKLSGWMYAVNGECPSYGCSSWKVKNGDVISWDYTCDLGKDLDYQMGEWD